MATATAPTNSALLCCTGVALQVRLLGHGDEDISAITSPFCPAVVTAVQDNICTAGMRTTAGSRVLDSYLPPFDATTVARLRAAGAVLIGKTNMDEFGMGSTTENSAYKVRTE